MTEVKILCRSCGGTGYWTARCYPPSPEVQVKIKCGQCGGKGYNMETVFEEKSDKPPSWVESHSKPLKPE